MQGGACTWDLELLGQVGETPVETGSGQGCPVGWVLGFLAGTTCLPASARSVLLSTRVG